MTDQEFRKRWDRLSKMQRKFCFRYIQNGFDPFEAAKFVGYNPPFCKAPNFRIMRKVNDVIDYLIAKNQIVQTIVKPTWILDQYLKMYKGTKSQSTKTNILKQLSKIYSMVHQNNTTVNVENNVPQTPVVIKFEQKDKK